MKTISSQLLEDLDLFSAAEYDAIYGPAELDDTELFNCEFERLRVAAGPHEAISLADILGSATAVEFADGSGRIENLQLRKVTAAEYYS